MSQENIEKFSSQMMELLPRLARGLAHYEHNELTRGRITLPQLWALDCLYLNEKNKMSDIARCLGISRAAATGLIDRLIAQELVSRKDDQADRRLVWIALTAKGRNVISRIRRQRIRTLIKVFGRISAKDRKHYLKILEQIVKITPSL